jgi:hypothetical protein
MGKTPSVSASAELVGVGSSEAVEVGTSLVVLAFGVSAGLTEGTAVDEGRSDSLPDDGASEGVGVAEGR